MTIATIESTVKLKFAPHELNFMKTRYVSLYIMLIGLVGALLIGGYVGLLIGSITMRHQMQEALPCVVDYFPPAP